MKALVAMLVLLSTAAILQSNTAEAACDICGACLDCGDHGRCEVVSDTAYCFCDPGWRGTYCTEVDPNYQIPIVTNDCDPNPCQNNGHCNPRSGSGYDCTCLPFYTGTNCDVPTTLNPCQLAAQAGNTCTRPGEQCIYFAAGGTDCI